jgi:hypothetical protein
MEMKKGLKLTLQIIGILLVVALIGGGIYWLVAHNSGMVLANSGFEGGRHAGGGFDGMRPGSDFNRTLPEGGLDGRGGHDRVNLASGLAGVGRIVLEIGVVTLGVLLVQWLIRKVRRPKAAAAVAAPVTVVTSEASVDASVNPVETPDDSQDLFPPTDEESKKPE